MSDPSTPPFRGSGIKKFFRKAWWGFWLASLPLGLYAQTTYTTALSPYPLENLGHSPRAYALGEAFAAVSGDPACLFYNPAGLYNLSSIQVSAMHQDWIAGISQETLLAGFPAGKAGAFAFGANYLDYGLLTGYDSLGNPTSSNSPFRGTFYAGWGGPFLSRLSVGLSARGLIQSLAPGVSSFSSSLQAGALWHLLPSLSLGGSYTLLDTDADLGLGFLNLGASWSFPFFLKNPTNLDLGFSLPLYNVARLQFGAEQPFLNFLVARLGYELELDDNDISGFRGLTGGFGFDFHDFSADYSYSPDGDLGSTQMVGLSYRFPEAPGRPTASTVGRSQRESLPPPILPETTQPKAFTTAPTPASSWTSPKVLFQTVPPLPSLPNTPPLPRPLVSPTPAVNPSGTPSVPALNFNPSATVLPSDQVRKVQTLFQIPSNAGSASATPATPSPEMEKALEAAGQKVSQNPQDPRSWMELGNLYWRSGQPDYAVQCFTEALRLKPDALALRDWLNRYQKAHPQSTPGE
jgi:hypothetical protein